MTTKWQEAAIETAARRFPKIGYNIADRDIWISMRDEAVARLPAGEKAPEGWIRINVLGRLQIEKQPLIDAILLMQDENYEFGWNGAHVIHLAYSDFEKAKIVEAGKIEFVQSGNHFSPDIAHLMLTISCLSFLDDDELYEIGGGVPASSEFADAREEAAECGEDGNDWIVEMMKVAEENIQASLRSIILFDDDTTDGGIDALLIDYKEA